MAITLDEITLTPTQGWTEITAKTGIIAISGQVFFAYNDNQPASNFKGELTRPADTHISVPASAKLWCKATFTDIKITVHEY